MSARTEQPESEIDAPPQRRRPRFDRLRKACLLVAIVNGLILVGWTSYVLIWYQTSRAAVEAEKQKLRDRGEPVYFAQLKPAPVPPQEDGTPLLLQAIELYRDLPHGFEVEYARYFQKGDGKVVGMMDDDPPLPESSLLFEQAIRENQELIRLLRAASAKGACKFPYDFDTRTPLGLAVPHVGIIRGAADLLQGEAINALAGGGSERSMECVHALLDLSELLRHESLLLDHLVRIAVAKRAGGTLIYVVANQTLTGDERIRLDKRLRDVSADWGVRNTLLADRAVMITQLECQEERCEDFFGQPASLSMRPTVFDQLTYYLRWMEKLLEHADETGPEAEQTITAMRIDPDSPPKDSYVTASVAPAYLALRAATLGARQYFANLRLALRLDRHYRQTGALPETLEEVLDESLPGIPPCVFSGRPPVYRKLPHGFALYDMGADLKDDQLQTRDIHETTTLVKVVYPEE